MWIKTTVLLCCVITACIAIDEHRPKKKDEVRGKRNLQYHISHHYSGPHSYRLERRISTGPQLPIYQTPYFPGPRSYSPYHKDGQHNEDLLTDNNHLNENLYGPPKHVVEKPVYIKEPEPIIEIIIKESNVSLPPPPTPPSPPPKKKEQVQVFYVKYKKNPNGHGKDSVIYDKPIPALSPPIPEEPEEEPPQPHYHHEVVTSPPPPSTTLRTIIRPDSETYHSPSGVKVTFGKEGFDYDKRSNKPEDLNAESVPRSLVQFPQGRQLSSFPPTFQRRPPTFSFNPTPTFRSEPSRQPQPYRPFNQPPPQFRPSSQTFFRQNPSSQYSTLPKFPQFSQQPKNGNQQFPPPRPVTPQFNQQQGPPSSPRQPVPYQPFENLRNHLPQSQLHFQQQSQLHFQEQSQPQPQHQSHHQPQPQHQSHNQPQPQPQHQSHHQPQLQHQSHSQPQPQPQIQSQPQTQNQPQHQPHVQQQIRFRPQSHFPVPQQPPLTQPPQDFNQFAQQNAQNYQVEHNRQVPPQSRPVASQSHPSVHHQQVQNGPNILRPQYKQEQQRPQPIQKQNDPQYDQHQQSVAQQNFPQIQNFNTLQQSHQNIIPPGGELIQSLPKFEQHISVLETNQGQQSFPIQGKQVQDTQQQQQQQTVQTLSQTEYNQKIQEQFRQANALQESIRQPSQQIQQQFSQGFPQLPTNYRASESTFYHTTSKPTTYSTTQRSFQTTTKLTSTTTQEPEKPSTTTKDPTVLNAQLPDEVPDDLREQLLSSGILNNADISILDYDKVGDIPLSALPPDQLANFYNAGGVQQIAAAGSEPVPSVVSTDGQTVENLEEEEGQDEEVAASEIQEVKALPEVQMKVVHYDPQTERGQQVQESYVKDNATQVDPVVLNDEKYNRYLPLKVSGTQFPIPDVPELKGKKITSVVVLAPVTYGFSSERKTREAKSDDKEVDLIQGETLKELLKNPTLDNYRKFLENENRTRSDKQSVILLVTGPSDNNEEKEIFMYDVATRTVSKLSGELSAAFVEAAEANSAKEEETSEDEKSLASNVVETRIPYTKNIENFVPSDVEVESSASDFVESNVPIIDPMEDDLDTEASEHLESFVDISGIPVAELDDLTAAASDVHSVDNSINNFTDDKTGRERSTV